ncbi:hypothetical protein RFI_09163 [Reticulomyxa filosa]|uniref:Uncharacterized protein n=1 Tax=Reticulomyxa filosa TaxID=46433 RepID=X6NQK1_RETFI|nr:hypothetical protein RFI_09163 [Reticulomyxa filosa]|eukprot:ETO27969.1 hypothetical protein RFI_09163 [Reticulomyxa filosa]
MDHSGTELTLFALCNILETIKAQEKMDSVTDPSTRDSLHSNTKWPKAQPTESLANTVYGNTVEDAEDEMESIVNAFTEKVDEDEEEEEKEKEKERIEALDLQITDDIPQSKSANENKDDINKHDQNTLPSSINNEDGTTSLEMAIVSEIPMLKAET